jgi:hypothetical protein
MKSFIKLFLPALALCSCSWFDDSPEKGASGPADQIPHDMIVLGDKLEDPYSVDNVIEAVSFLYPTRAGRIDIRPTDLYVRFLPRTEDEYNRLVSLGLLLIDHPIDYEVVREGDYYHDPSLDEDSITWQYAVVKPDFGFPEGIRHEVLDQCYISDHDPATRAGDIDWAAVEREAFRLTGNAGLLQPEVRGASEPAKPSGRLCIVDERHGDEPEGIAGVRVSCNTFVKFAHAYTDPQGYYSMDREFATELRYRIVFQNEKGFGIGLNKILVPASTSTMGKAGPEGVSITVDKNSDRRLFTRSVVNNAAYDYYESCASREHKILPPPANTRIWLFQALEVCSTPMFQQGVLIDDTVVGQFLGEYSKYVKMFLPDITLGVKGVEDYSTLYGGTVHELAHASHFSQVGKEYWNRYVEYVMTSFIESGGRMYGVGSGTGAGHCEVGEMWGYYVQNRLYKERYGEDKTTFGTSYWFHPHVLLYLDERGLDRSGIFKALQPEVTSKNALQEKLGSLYPEYGVIINQAFDRYED